MTEFFVYILKTNALLIIFYLSYHFLVQKETFFNSNRWFLLSGLFISTILPFIYFKKIQIIEKSDTFVFPISTLNHSVAKSNIIITDSFNFYELIPIIYSIIIAILTIKLIIELISFFKLIKNKQINIIKPFAFVDINENINPFSFFKYIVYNSNKYTHSELESILSHEKVHSQEKHSIDILISKIYCILFWFNPVVWMYKKAIIQNLEYIADKKAIKKIGDKKAYQLTLLKIVTDHNYSSITSSFYQSLIKKRIVMLNKNQSKQKNAFKYAFIIPVIIVFMVLFQIKIVAQENQSKPQNDTDVSPDTKQVVEMVWDKTTNDEEIQNDIKWMKKEGLNIVVRELNRNSKDEIINIKIEFTDKSGKKGKFSHSGDEPIKPIVLRREIEKNNKTTVSLAELTKLEEELITPIAPIAPLETENFAELPEVPLVPEIPDTPLIQAPSNTNDEKAWREYENQIKKQELAMLAQDSEMKKYEAQMQAYEEKMRAREKKLEAHENEMKRFDQQMEVYQKNIENYYKKIDHYRKLEKKE